MKMASTGKTKKKQKKQTVSLQDFLAKGNENIQAGYSVVTAKRSAFDWATEAEKERTEEEEHQSVGRDQYILPSAPMGPNIDMSKVPKSPPFTAFIGGLPQEFDQEELKAFFKHLKVVSVRIPRQGSETQRFRGFGYVEFEDRDSLIDALGMNESFFKIGRVKIDVAENQDDPKRRDKSDRGGDKTDRSESMTGDWRAPREDSSKSDKGDRSYRDGPPKEREQRYGDRYSNDNRSQYGNRGFDRGSYNDRSDRERDRDRDRDQSYGGFRDRDRGSYGGFRGSSDRGFSDRQRDSGTSERGYDRGNRGRREFGTGHWSEEKSDYGSRGNWSSNYDRQGESADFTPNYEKPEREQQQQQQPRERQKLVLKPRTVPLEEASGPVGSSAIFGGAKPVDTAAREREIEERLAKERELAATRSAAEAKSKESERDRLDSDRQRKSSTGSQSSSVRSSASVGAPAQRLGDGGVQVPHSPLTDEEKLKFDKAPQTPPVLPPSPRNEEYKTVPAPLPKENVWRIRTQSSSNAKPSDTEKENIQNNSPQPNHSGGSSDSPQNSSMEHRASYSKNDEYARRKDESTYKGYSEQDRNDRGAMRGIGRGTQRGGSRTARSSYDRGSGSENYRNSHSEAYDTGSSRGRGRQKEIPKFVDPESSTYVSSNKFTGLDDQDYDE